jgi:hypothetical protein
LLSVWGLITALEMHQFTLSQKGGRLVRKKPRKRAASKAPTKKRAAPTDAARGLAAERRALQKRVRTSNEATRKADGELGSRFKLVGNNNPTESEVSIELARRKAAAGIKQVQTDTARLTQLAGDQKEFLVQDKADRATANAEQAQLAKDLHAETKGQVRELGREAYASSGQLDKTLGIIHRTIEERFPAGGTAPPATPAPAPKRAGSKLTPPDSSAAAATPKPTWSDMARSWTGLKADAAPERARAGAAPAKMGSLASGPLQIDIAEAERELESAKKKRDALIMQKGGKNINKRREAAKAEVTNIKKHLALLHAQAGTPAHLASSPGGVSGEGFLGGSKPKQKTKWTPQTHFRRAMGLSDRGEHAKALELVYRHGHKAPEHAHAAADYIEENQRLSGGGFFDSYIAPLINAAHNG